MTNLDMLKMFEAVSVLFRASYQEPLWGKYCNHLDNSIDAGCIFFGGYAFEHQGRSPSYSPAAIKAIKMSEDNHDSPQEIWKNFGSFLNNKGLNKDINPLYHDDNLCNTKEMCIWCALGSENIVSVSKEDLDFDKIKAAHDRLKRIRGVGNKIASLFLRDVAVNYNLTPVKDRWLLQPVDIWVRRIVQSLNESKEMDNKGIAEWIVVRCKECNINPEQCNQGMWYFAARIAGSDFELERSLQDMRYARILLEDHISDLKTSSLAAIELEMQLNKDK